MKSDLWQRRVGWLALVAVILFSGAVAQTRLLAADDAQDQSSPGSKADIDKKMKENLQLKTHEKEQRDVEAAKEKVRAQMEQTQQDMATAKEKARAQMEKAQQEMEKARAEYQKAFEQSLAPQIRYDFKQLQQKFPQFGGDSGKYWIGVECREASPELRAQLGLKDNEGLVVMHVAEDSPAAKAGIKQHDVIVAVGKGGTPHPLSNVADLIKVMDQSEGKDVVPLKIVRAGKEQTVDVTPAERPDVTARLLMQPGQGYLYSGNVMKAPPLPDNVSVTVTRQGDKPAKVVVSRGDDKWELTDGELDKLPEDLRPIVQGMLGGGPMTITIGPGGKTDAYNKMLQILTQPEKAPTWAAPQFPQPPQAGVAPQPPSKPYKAPAVDPEALMRRLDELDRRLDQLQQELRGPRDGRDPMPRMRPPRGEDSRDAEKLTPRDN